VAVIGRQHALGMSQALPLHWIDIDPPLSLVLDEPALCARLEPALCALLEPALCALLEPALCALLEPALCALLEPALCTWLLLAELTVAEDDVPCAALLMAELDS
jgi:hypothetical protein